MCVCVCVCVCVLGWWSRVWLCDAMDCNLPGSSVHGILQARIPERVTISSSKGSSQPRDWSRVSCIAGGFFIHWVIRESHGQRSLVGYCPQGGKRVIHGLSTKQQQYLNNCAVYLKLIQHYKSTQKKERLHLRICPTFRKVAGVLYSHTG